MSESARSTCPARGYSSIQFAGPNRSAYTLIMSIWRLSWKKPPGLLRACTRGGTIVTKAAPSTCAIACHVTSPLLAYKRMMTRSRMSVQ